MADLSKLQTAVTHLQNTVDAIPTPTDNQADVDALVTQVDAITTAIEAKFPPAPPAE